MSSDQTTPDKMTPENLNPASYDVIIIGGGMVGLTLAACLARQDFQLAVIENRKPLLDWPEDSIDLRVSAITAASQQIFTRLDVWKRIMQLGISPFREMHVWDAAGSGEIHFDCADVGELRLGHIIENRVIQKSLYEKLATLDNVHIYCPAKVERCVYTGEGVSILLDNAQSLSGRLCVGADGSQSKTREQAGIDVAGWSYHQRAIVTHVGTEYSHGETAWQRFLPTGPLAFLPLANGHSSIVWSVDEPLADELLRLDEPQFMDRLARDFDCRLGKITSIGQRSAFPLRMQYASSYIGHRLALVGDAAHTIHPLAGQGVNLGILDAAALSEVLSSVRSEGRDFAQKNILRRYERWRKGDNLLTMYMMDGFKRLFGSYVMPVRILRNRGLDLVDGVLPVKTMLMRHAMGLSGDLPSMARTARV